MKKIIFDKIVPSKPFEDLLDLQTLADKCFGKVGRIQIDICDGKYVPSLSWPIAEYGIKSFLELSQKKDFDVELPHWQDISYTADMMILEPEKYIDTLVQYGVDEIIIHFRSMEDDLKVFEIIKEKCLRYDLRLYVATDVLTEAQKFEEFLRSESENIYGVQVMGIEKIGYQGQEFAQKSLEIVKKIRADFPVMLIMFDGAVNDDTVDSILDAGVDVICPGSFLQNDFSEKIKYLKKVIGAENDEGL